MRILVFKFAQFKFTNLTTAHIIILSLMKEKIFQSDARNRSSPALIELNALTCSV